MPPLPIKRTGLLSWQMKTIISSGRQVLTGIFSDEPDKFYVLHPRNRVDGPYPLTDRRFA
jgi:hypothetical protein